MADSANKEQLGILLTPEARKLLDALHERAKQEDGPISLSAFVERLIRREAKRQGEQGKRQR